MPGLDALKVNDRSVAFMVVDAPDGVSTAVSCAGSAEVPCTYCLSETVVRVSGAVCLTTGSITAANVLAGFTEKYTMPVPVCWPSETVTSMPARPEDMDPALNTSCPSARVETVTWSVFCGVADMSVSGSLSGSEKLPNALVV